MKETLNYEETLALVETFLIDSGIRQYCTQNCKGECCESLRPKCTTVNCRTRKLSCSVYICSALLSVCFNKQTRINYYKLRSLMSDELKRNTDYIGDRFYTHKTPQEIINNFKISKKVFFKLFPADSEMKVAWHCIRGMKWLEHKQKRITA